MIFHDTNSDEYLAEMAYISSSSDENYGISIIMVPETKNIGNPYFKVYDNCSQSKATKVARISFLKPILITGHAESGKKEWKLEDFSKNPYRKNLIKYLNDRSGANRNVSVWTMLRYQWNLTLSLNNFKNIENYISGKYDTPENLKNPDYLPYNLQIPDYLDSLENDPKGKIKRGNK